MPFTDPSPAGDFFISFLGILFEGAPYIFLGALIAGFIDAYLPSKTLEKILPKNAGLAVVASAFLGLPFPVCECAIVPVIRRLVQKGLPVACGVAYMLASPIVNPITAFSTWNAFYRPNEELQTLAWSMTGYRLGLGLLCAIGVGLIVLQLKPATVLLSKLITYKKKENDPGGETDHDHDHDHHDHDHHHHDHHHDDHDRGHHDHDHHHHHGDVKPDRLIRAFRSTQRDFIDTALFFTIGIAVTAFFNTQIDKGFVAGIASNEWLASPSMMLLAFVLSLCSTSDAFVAANLPLPLSSKLSFLVFGPMVDVKLVFMYATVFRVKFIAFMCLGLFVAVGIVSVLLLGEDYLNGLGWLPGQGP
ncbi:MAG: permease [Verrucomicrobiota bacterium]